MLVPVFALLLLGDHPNRVRASLRFFIFTQAGGLLMLVSIFGLYFFHGQATGEYTFASEALLNTPLSATASKWIFLGFFLDGDGYGRGGLGGEATRQIGGHGRRIVGGSALDQVLRSEAGWLFGIGIGGRRKSRQVKIHRIAGL